MLMLIPLLAMSVGTDCQMSGTAQITYPGQTMPVNIPSSIVSGPTTVYVTASSPSCGVTGTILWASGMVYNMSPAFNRQDPSDYTKWILEWYGTTPCTGAILRIDFFDSDGMLCNSYDYSITITAHVTTDKRHDADLKKGKGKRMHDKDEYGGPSAGDLNGKMNSPLVFAYGPYDGTNTYVGYLMPKVTTVPRAFYVLPGTPSPPTKSWYVNFDSPNHVDNQPVPYWLIIRSPLPGNTSFHSVLVNVAITDAPPPKHGGLHQLGYGTSVGCDPTPVDAIPACCRRIRLLRR